MSSGAVLKYSFLVLLFISLWKLNLVSWNNFLICNLTCKKIFTPHTLAYLSVKWAIWHRDWQFKWEQTTNEWCRKLNLREPQRLVQRAAWIKTKWTISQGMRDHWGSQGIIPGVCYSIAVCQCAGHTPSSAVSSSSLPSAQALLDHQPCPASALEMGAVPREAQQAELHQTAGASTPGSWLCPGRWTKQAEAPAAFAGSGKAEHRSVSWGCKTCLAACSPGLLIFLMLVRGEGRM